MLVLLRTSNSFTVVILHLPIFVLINGVEAAGAQIPKIGMKLRRCGAWTEEPQVSLVSGRRELQGSFGTRTMPLRWGSPSSSDEVDEQAAAC